MILKLGTLNDLERINGELPEEVFWHLHSNIQILDENYGATRDVDRDDGGYALLFDHEEDLHHIRTSEKVNFTYHVPEWVDLIETDGRNYASALYLTSNDFGILLIAPVQILSQLPGILDAL